jgi:hypothetical protein
VLKNTGFAFSIILQQPSTSDSSAERKGVDARAEGETVHSAGGFPRAAGPTR